MEDYPKDVYRVRVGDWDMQVSRVGNISQLSDSFNACFVTGT